MNTVSIILMVLFAIGIIVFIILTTRNTSKNEARQTSNKLIPFAGYLAPPNGYPNGGMWSGSPNPNNVGTGALPEDGLFLVGMAGGSSNTAPQITCPAGTSINIVGAFIEVNDPYQTCQPSSDPTFQLSCGSTSNLSSAQLCSGSGQADCPLGMQCKNGRCVPNTCSSNTECGSDSIPACPTDYNTPCPQGTKDGTRHPTVDQLVCLNGVYEFDPAYGQCAWCTGTGTCANVPMCQGLKDTTSYLNTACQNGNCKLRDASAYLAGYCDGKTTCLGTPADRWNPNDPTNNPFGPLPCKISALSTDPDYASLPIIPGWNQNNPLNATTALNKSNFSQGYYVHGIYTCIPNGELPGTTTPSS